MAARTVPDYYQLMLGFLGINEAQNKAQIDKFWIDIGLPQFAQTPEIEPWCAGSLSYVLKATGYAIPKGYEMARARAFADEALFMKVPEPRIGDIVVLNYGMKGVIDHVTLYADQTDPAPPPAGYIRCLGGNQSDSVRFSNFKKADVVGYYRPRKLITQPTAAPSGEQISPAETAGVLVGVGAPAAAAAAHQPTLAIILGIVVIAGAVFYIIRHNKKRPKPQALRA